MEIMNLKNLVDNINREEETTIKKEIIKTVIVVNLLRINKNMKTWINIYNNFEVSKNKTCDIYFENIKTKKVILFKIVKKRTKEKIEQLKEELEKIEFNLFDSKVFIFDMDNFSEEIFERDKKIKEYLK